MSATCCGYTSRSQQDAKTLAMPSPLKVATIPFFNETGFPAMPKTLPYTALDTFGSVCTTGVGPGLQNLWGV